MLWGHAAVLRQFPGYGGGGPVQQFSTSNGAEPLSVQLNPGTRHDLHRPGGCYGLLPSGFGEMSCQFHKAIRKNLIRDSWADLRKPVLINHWETTEMYFTAGRLVKIAQDASRLGLELFVMDDGWPGAWNDDNAGLGDWVVNEEKLPSGLEALAARIKELGIEFGIWIELEMINEDSNLYCTHPDWILNVPGRRPSRGRNQCWTSPVKMCGNMSTIKSRLCFPVPMCPTSNET